MFYVCYQQDLKGLVTKFGVQTGTQTESRDISCHRREEEKIEGLESLCDCVLVCPFEHYVCSTQESCPTLTCEVVFAPLQNYPVRRLLCLVETNVRQRILRQCYRIDLYPVTLYSRSNTDTSSLLSMPFVQTVWQLPTFSLYYFRLFSYFLCLPFTVFIEISTTVYTSLSVTCISVCFPP